MTTTEPVVRLAVLSDLHAYAAADSGKEPSYLQVTDELQRATDSPFEGLSDLILTNKLVADFLLCPGDLGDKADPKGIAHAWHRIQDVAKLLGNATYVASTGNHDMDSKLLFHRHDPTDALKRLSPPYPVDNLSEVDRYWSRYFCISENSNCRVVSLNSSAFHWLEAERYHGRVSISTLDWLKTTLASLDEKPISVLLCHHHPHLHSELASIDASYEVMKDGDRLIEILGKGDIGQWLIVHGHKHFPQIAYGAGAMQPPVVFSCGSFSARLYKDLQTRARNQFYIVEIPLAKVEKLGLVGIIQAWDWSVGKGWIVPDGDSSGLASLTPFGNTENPISLASRLSESLGDEPFAPWPELVTKIPSLEFLLPKTLRAIDRALVEKYQLKINWVEGHPRELGRMAS